MILNKWYDMLYGMVCLDMFRFCPQDAVVDNKIQCWNDSSYWVPHAAIQAHVGTRVRLPICFLSFKTKSLFCDISIYIYIYLVITTVNAKMLTADRPELCIPYLTFNGWLEPSGLQKILATIPCFWLQSFAKVSESTWSSQRKPED